MTTRQTVPGDLKVDSTAASPGTFNEWLRRRLKASRLTQRQLAEKTGVDHSTISRLVRGNRLPSLRTAASLARGLGAPDGLATQGDLNLRSRQSRAAGVEYALRSDESLDDAQVHEIMEIYLAARLRHIRPVGAVPQESTRSAPVPIVVQVPALSSRSGPRRSPTSPRGHPR